MSFVERLRAAMRLRRLDDKELASRAKVSHRYVNALTSGEKGNPTVQRAAALARALDVSLDWMMEIPEKRAGALSPDEEELLALYRSLDKATREKALAMLSVFSQR